MFNHMKAMQELTGMVNAGVIEMQNWDVQLLMLLHWGEQ